MLFLIEYDRNRGTIVNQQAFAESARQQANDARLALELQLTEREEAREIVLLEAESEDALRLTHRRFFEDIATLMRTPPTGHTTVGGD